MVFNGKQQTSMPLSEKCIWCCCDFLISHCQFMFVPNCSWVIPRQFNKSLQLDHLKI